MQRGELSCFLPAVKPQQPILEVGENSPEQWEWGDAAQGDVVQGEIVKIRHSPYACI